MMGQRMFHRKKRNRYSIAGCLLLLPGFVGVLTFAVYPFGKAMFYSLHRGLENGRFVGLDNYADLFSNAAFLHALQNSFRFYLIALPLILLLPLIPAILFARYPRISACLDFTAYAMILCAGASLMTFTDLLVGEHGMFSDAIAGFFSIEADRLYDSEFAFVLLILLYLYRYGGFNYLLYHSALRQIPVEYYEEAVINGAGWHHILWYITLPSLRPTAAAVLTLSVLHSYHLYQEVFQIGGYYPHDSIYLLQHFMNNNFVSMNYNRLCCVSVMILLFTVLLSTFIYLAVRIFTRRLLR